MKITKENQPGDEAPSNGTSNQAPSHGTPNMLPAHVMEQSMYGAIDAMMASEEQSYEEFMQSFIYLTPEDVVAVGGNQTRLDPKSSTSHDLNIPASRDSSASSRQDKTNTQVNDTESLDEEVLGAGTTSSISHGTVSKIRGLKIDNFVDDETSSLSDSDEGLADECVEYSGYQASFSRENPINKKGNNDSIKAPRPETCCDSFPNSTGADVKTSLILNNQTTLCTDPLNTTASLPADVRDEQDSHSESDLVYNPRLDRLNPGEVDTELEKSNVKEVNFRTMGYSARPGDPLQLKEETHVPEENCDTVAETTQEADCTCSLSQEENDNITCDAVQPFVLDDDFDYDNVLLTPKYTAEEMAQIMSALDKGPVYVPPPSSDTEEEDS